MDQVVKLLYDRLEVRDAKDGRKSLIVLVGDHGMTEVSPLGVREDGTTGGDFSADDVTASQGGNHGGSTEAETSAVRVILFYNHTAISSTTVARPSGSAICFAFDATRRIHSPAGPQLPLPLARPRQPDRSCPYPERSLRPGYPDVSLYSQVGYSAKEQRADEVQPLPSNSMGKLIELVVERWAVEPIAELLARNARQLGGVLELAVPGASSALSCEASVRKDGGCDRAVEDLNTTGELSRFLALAQERLRTTFGDYHIGPMLVGLVLLAFACSLLSRLAARFLSTEDDSAKAFVLPAMGVYLATFFATSFIEEEHEFWFFATATGLLSLASRSAQHAIHVLRTVSDTDACARSIRRRLSLLQRAALLLAATSVRLMRAWSANGQKDLPNLSISHALAVHPRTSAQLSFATYALAASLPFYLFFRAAQPHNRPQGATVVGMFLRALSFALLLTGLLLQLVVVMALQGGGERLKVFGMAGRVELARVVYGLGAGVWAGARVARVAEEGEAGHLRVVQLLGLSLVLVSLSKGVNVGLFLLMWVQYGAAWAVRREVSPLGMAGMVVAFQQVAFYAFGGSNSLAT